MADEWVELTPAAASREIGYKDGPIQVNLSNATSIWSHENGSEIWFFATGDNARRFYVTETPKEILAKRRTDA